MKRIYLKKVEGVLVLLALLVGLAAPASACVGKSLLIGTTGSVQQDLLAQMLSLLIAERTGTTVKVVKFPTGAAAHEALLKADLDIKVEYTGVGQVEVLKGAPIEDPAALYQEVKTAYNRDLNLVWLAPFGFDEPRVAPAGVAAQAAPVVRKDTLKKFPALARLINKLGGAVDGPAMARLEAAAATRDVQEVAREFLKGGKFI